MMRKNLFSALPLLMFSLLVAAPLPNQSRKSLPEPSYNPSAVVDVVATVREVREVTSEPLRGQHLIVRVGRENVDVYLGPVEFLKSCGITFEKGDQVHLTGSRTKVDGAAIVLAQEVRRRGVSLTLRDEQGRPNW